jgi:hypothetical protein
VERAHRGGVAGYRQWMEREWVCSFAAGMVRGPRGGFSLGVPGDPKGLQGGHTKVSGTGRGAFCLFCNVLLDSLQLMLRYPRSMSIFLLPFLHPPRPVCVSLNRFVGHSMDQYFSYLMSISNDVLLWEKATVLSSRIFSIILRFEKRNKIIERLRFYFTKIIFALTSFFKR